MFPRLSAILILVLISVESFGVDMTGYVGLEYRYFLQEAFDTRQHGANLSLAIEPEIYHEWDNGYQSLAFVPYFRLDEHDNRRTHLDIREMTWVKATEGWELRTGIRKVFWGVTEFQHLVDIINQSDLIEDIDMEDKLGQPMIDLALIRDWGTIDLFYLPYFRERTFPGPEGRLRTKPYIDVDQSRYESGAQEWHQDLALRYYHSIGDWDIGVAHFFGTSRDPMLLHGIDNSGGPVLIPYYAIINQTSLDLQGVKGNMLWKLEVLHRSGQGETYNALAAGFEYTVVGIFETSMDLGVLGEYHYDDRGVSAPVLFQDDIGLGMRLAFNDIQSSQALIGLVCDRDSGAKFFNIEASRRFGQNWVLDLQARLLFDQSRNDPSFNFSRDDYIQLFLTFNF